MSKPKGYSLLTGTNAYGTRTAVYNDDIDPTTREVVGMAGKGATPAEVHIGIGDGSGAKRDLWTSFHAEALLRIIRHVAPEEFARAAREFVKETVSARVSLVNDLTQGMAIGADEAVRVLNAIDPDVFPGARDFVAENGGRR
ncbi:hypothetical protein ACUH93_00640 [Dermabacteraceae bacterium P7006]